MLNRETLEPYRLPRTSLALVGNGYDRMPIMDRRGWQLLPSWGRDGWDCGSWPLVVFYVRDVPSTGGIVSSADLQSVGSLSARDYVGYWLATDIEGDVDTWRFATKELRQEAIDYLFAWYAVSTGQDWAAGWDPEDPATVPEKFRGPYRREVAS